MTANRTISMLLVLALTAGCHSNEPPPPPKAAPPPPVQMPPGAALQLLKLRQSHATGLKVLPPIAALRLRPDGGTPPAPPPATIDDYMGFSGDGLVFAYALFSSDAGVLTLRFQSATTNTIEKSLPLDNDVHRHQAEAALAEDGFPHEHAAPPPALGATVSNGRVRLTFSGAPASKEWQPFSGVPGVKIDKAEVVAASADGKYAAVRVIGAPPAGKAGLTEFHVFTLFE